VTEASPTSLPTLGNNDTRDYARHATSAAAAAAAGLTSLDAAKIEWPSTSNNHNDNIEPHSSSGRYGILQTENEAVSGPSWSMGGTPGEG